MLMLEIAVLNTFLPTLRSKRRKAKTVSCSKRCKFDSWKALYSRLGMNIVEEEFDQSDFEMKDFYVAKKSRTQAKEVKRVKAQDF